MAIILLTGFIMSLFLIVLLLGKRNKLLDDKALLSIFAVYALTIGGLSSAYHPIGLFRKDALFFQAEGS